MKIPFFLIFSFKDMKINSQVSQLKMEKQEVFQLKFRTYASLFSRNLEHISTNMFFIQNKDDYFGSFMHTKYCATPKLPVQEMS